MILSLVLITTQGRARWTEPMANVCGSSEYSLGPVLEYLLDTGQSLCPVRVQVEKKDLGFHGVAITQHEEVATNSIQRTPMQTETREDPTSDTNVRHYSCISPKATECRCIWANTEMRSHIPNTHSVSHSWCQGLWVITEMKSKVCTGQEKCLHGAQC